MTEIDPEELHFRFSYPYPNLSAEHIAELEQKITEEIVRPIAEKYND